MDRREWITTTVGALGAMGLMNSAFAEGKKKDKPAMAHDHSMMENPFAKAIETAADCVKKGEACIAHCQMMIAKGDTTMADCLRTSLEMIAGCEALVRLGNLQSKSIKKIAAVCAELCRECEKACKNHEQHAVCKTCMEACVACAKECDKIAV